MAKYYVELLNKIKHIEVQREAPNSRHTYQSFTCIINKSRFRDKIIGQLAKSNIESQIGTYALHCLPRFRNCLKNTKLENSAAAADTARSMGKRSVEDPVQNP